MFKRLHGSMKKGSSEIINEGRLKLEKAKLMESCTGFNHDQKVGSWLYIIDVESGERLARIWPSDCPSFGGQLEMALAYKTAEFEKYLTDVLKNHQKLSMKKDESKASKIMKRLMNV